MNPPSAAAPPKNMIFNRACDFASAGGGAAGKNFAEGLP